MSFINRWLGLTNDTDPKLENSTSADINLADDANTEKPKPITHDRYGKIDEYPSEEMVAKIQQEEALLRMEEEMKRNAQEVLLSVPVEQVDINLNGLELPDVFSHHDVLIKLYGHLDRISTKDSGALMKSDIAPIMFFRINTKTKEEPENLFISKPIIIKGSFYIIGYIVKRKQWCPVIYKKSNDGTWRHLSIDNNKIFDSAVTGETNRSKVTELLGYEFDSVIKNYESQIIAFDENYLSDFFRIYNYSDSPSNAGFIDNGLLNKFRDIYRDLYSGKGVDISEILSLNYPKGFVPNFPEAKLFNKYNINISVGDKEELCPVFVFEGKLNNSQVLWHFTYSVTLEKVWIHNITLKKNIGELGTAVSTDIGNSGVFKTYINSGILSLDPLDEGLQSKGVDISEILNSLAPIQGFIGWLNQRAKKNPNK